jgi:hypothetical protein
MMKFNFEKPKLLYLLLLADVIFILLHLAYVYTPHLPNPYFSLSLPRSYSEFFQYTKFLWITTLFLVLAVRLRRWIYAIFSVLFLFFLIDDSFEFHENYGAYIADFFHFQPVFGLRARDLGELTVVAFFGALFLAALGTAYALSRPEDRRVANQVFVLVILLGIFGVFFDMVEIVVENAGISRVLRVLEEGGEMIVTSFITWFTFWLDPRTISMEEDHE